MINNRQIRVSPLGGNQWKVHKPWAQRDIKHFDNQFAAKKFAEDIAKKEKLEMIIQKRDGTICERNSYGNDPCPPRDKK